MRRYGRRLRLVATWAVLALIAAGCSQQPAVPTAPATPRFTDEPSPVTPSASPAAVCTAAEPSDGHSDGEVLVYFTCGTLPIAPVVAVTRAGEADTAEDRLAVAIEQLIAGPTEVEQAGGYRSWFSSETAGMLNGVTLDDGGHAQIDFADFSAVIPNASTSAGQRQLLAEIEATVFQFSEVSSVELQFDGSCDAFWGWLQSICTSVERPPT